MGQKLVLLLVSWMVQEMVSGLDWSWLDWSWEEGTFDNKGPKQELDHSCRDTENPRTLRPLKELVTFWSWPASHKGLAAVHCIRTSEETKGKLVSASSLYFGQYSSSTYRGEPCPWWYIPIAEVLVEDRSLVESGMSHRQDHNLRRSQNLCVMVTSAANLRLAEILYFWYIPDADVLIEWPSLYKHARHRCCFPNIPAGDILVERCRRRKPSTIHKTEFGSHLFAWKDRAIGNSPKHLH